MDTCIDTSWIVEQAKSLGFDLCGVVRPDQFSELEHTAEWLARGYAGDMKYLADPRRADPRAAMPGARSIIVCLLNYNTARPLSTESPKTDSNGEPCGWISRYAWGEDYHAVLGKKLERLVNALRKQFSEPFEARTYVDTGPVQERILAKYAGLGWLGKNTLLLHPRLGSYFFLGVIFTTLELKPTLAAYELPAPDLCGSCTRCLDACPTQAFVEPYVMDARKCISYLTIELRREIPEEFRPGLGNHVFGCDICQDVCPWNRRAPLTTIAEFEPRTVPTGKEQQAGWQNEQQTEEEQSLFSPRLEKFLELSESGFTELFRGSAVKRAKWRGLLRNACIAAGNSGMQPNDAGYAGICTALQGLSACDDSIIAESAQWALSRIQQSAQSNV